MSTIAIMVLDPRGNAFAQLIDDRMPVRALVPILVPRLGLPTEVSYVLVPAGSSTAIPVDHSLSMQGLGAGAQIRLLPYRDSIFTAFINKLYAEAQKYVNDKLWDLARQKLEVMFKTWPECPDPAGLADIVAKYGRKKLEINPAKTSGAKVLFVLAVLGFAAYANADSIKKWWEKNQPSWLRHNLSKDGKPLGTGDIQATLRWQGGPDVDLHVVDPNGDEISYEKKISRSGGRLDADDQLGGGPENIFWPAGGAPAGHYRVYVKLFRGTAADYQVDLLVNGHTEHFSGSLRGEKSEMEVTSFEFTK